MEKEFSRTGNNIEKVTKNNSGSEVDANEYKKFLLTQYLPKYQQGIGGVGRMITDSGDDADTSNYDNDKQTGTNEKNITKEIGNRIERLSDSSSELEKLLKSQFDPKPESVKKYIISLLYYIKIASDAKVVQVINPPSSDHRRNISPLAISNYDQLLKDINELLGTNENNPAKDYELQNLINKNSNTTKDLISSFINLFKKYNSEIVSNLINDGLGVSLKKLDNITGLIKHLATLKPYDSTKIHYIKLDISGFEKKRQIKFSTFGITKPEANNEEYLVVDKNNNNNNTISSSSSPVAYGGAITLSTNPDKTHKHNRFIICGTGIHLNEVQDIIKKGLTERKEDFGLFKKELEAHINLTAVTSETVNSLINKTIETANNRILGYDSENSKYIPGNFDYFFKRPIEAEIKNEIKEFTKFPEYDSNNSKNYIKELTDYVGSLEQKLDQFSSSVLKNIESVTKYLAPKEDNKFLKNNYLNVNNTNNKTTKKVPTKVVNKTANNSSINLPKTVDEANNPQTKINEIRSKLLKKVETFSQKIKSELQEIITEKVSYAKYIQKAYDGAKEGNTTKIEKLPDIYARPDELYGEFFYPFKEQLEKDKDNKVLGAIRNVGLALSKTQVEFLKNAINKIRGGGNILNGKLSIGNIFINEIPKKCFTIPFYAQAGAGKTFTLNGFNEPAFSTNLTEENYNLVKKALSDQGIDEGEIKKFIAPKKDSKGKEIKDEYICSLSLLVQNLLPQNNAFKTINLNYHQSKEEIEKALKTIKSEAETGQNYFLNIDESHNYGSADNQEYYEKLALIKEFKRDYNQIDNANRGVVAIVEATATPDLLNQGYKSVKHSDSNEAKKKKADQEIKAREVKVGNIKNNLTSKQFKNENDKVNLIIDPALPAYSDINLHSLNEKWRAIFEEATQAKRNIAIQYKNKSNDSSTYRFFIYENGAHKEYDAVIDVKSTTVLTSIPQDKLNNTNLIYDINNYTGGDFQIKSWPADGANIIIRNLKALVKDYSDPSLISEDMIQMLRRYRPFNFDDKNSYQNVFIQDEKGNPDQDFYTSLKNKNSTKISLTNLEKFFQQRLAKNKNNESDYFDLNLVAELFVSLKTNIISKKDQEKAKLKHKREYALAQYLLDKNYDSNKSVEGLNKVKEFNENISKFSALIESKQKSAKSIISELEKGVNNIKINNANVVTFKNPTNNKEPQIPYLKYVAKVNDESKKIDVGTIIVGSGELFISGYHKEIVFPPCFNKADNKKDEKEITLENFKTETENLLKSVESFQQNKQKEIDEQNKKNNTNNIVRKNDLPPVKKQEAIPINDNNLEQKISELTKNIKNNYALSDSILKIEILKNIIKTQAEKNNSSAAEVITMAASHNDVKSNLLEKFKSDLGEIFKNGMTKNYQSIELLNDGKILAEDLKKALNEIGINEEGKEADKVAIGAVLDKFGNEKLKDLVIKIFSSERNNEEKNKEEILNAFKNTAEELLNKKIEDAKREESEKLALDRKNKEALENQKRIEEESKKINSEKERKEFNKNAIKESLKKEHGFTKGDLDAEDGTFSNSIFHNAIELEVKSEGFNPKLAVQNVLNKVAENQEKENKKFFSDIFWSDITRIVTRSTSYFPKDPQLINSKKVDLSKFDIPKTDLPKDPEKIINSFKTNSDFQDLPRKVFLSDPKENQKEVIDLLNQIRTGLKLKSEEEGKEQSWEETKKQREKDIKDEIADGHGFKLNELDVKASVFKKDTIFQRAIKCEAENKDKDYDSKTAVKNVLENAASNTDKDFLAEILCNDLKNFLVIKETGFFKRAANLVKESVKNYVPTQVIEPTLLNKNKVGLLLQNQLQEEFKRLSTAKNKLDEKVIFSEEYIDSFINNLKKDKEEKIKELAKEIFVSDPKKDKDSNMQKIIGLFDEKIKEMNINLEDEENNNESEENQENTVRNETSTISFDEFNISQIYPEIPEEDKNIEKQEENLEALEKNLKDRGSYTALEKIGNNKKLQLKLKSAAENITDFNPNKAANTIISEAVKEDSKKNLFRIFSEDLTNIINNKNPVSELNLLNDKKINISELKNFLNTIIEDDSSLKDDYRITSEQLLDYLNKNQEKFQEVAGKILESEEKEQKQNLELIENALNEIVKTIKNEEESKDAKKLNKTSKTTKNPVDNLGNKSKNTKGPEKTSEESLNNPLDKSFDPNTDKKELNKSGIIGKSSDSSDENNFCTRETNKKPKEAEKKPDEIRIGFLRLHDFTIQTSKVTNNSKSDDDVNFCYVMEPDDLKKSNDEEVQKQIADGGRISPKLIIKQNKEKTVCISTICGSDFKVSYGPSGGEEVKGGIITSVESIANGNVAQEKLNNLIEENKTKFDGLIKAKLENPIDINKVQIPTIPKFPISFKKDGNVCYSINLLKSDDKNINVVFMTPKNIDDIPDDASNVQHIHIPGTGLNGKKSYKAKVELILDDEKTIGGKVYQKGDIAIYPDPVEIKDGKPAVAEDDKEYKKAKKLMSEMKITALRQIAHVIEGEKKIEIGRMTFLTGGEKGKDGTIFDIDKEELKSINLSITFSEVIDVIEKNKYKDNTELLGIKSNKAASPIVKPNSAIKLRNIEKKEIRTAAMVSR